MNVTYKNTKLTYGACQDLDFSIRIFLEILLKSKRIPTLFPTFAPSDPILRW
jgi:hypothetical protein